MRNNDKEREEKLHKLTQFHVDNTPLEDILTEYYDMLHQEFDSLPEELFNTTYNEMEM
jgi:hypothetical protein